MRSYVINLDIDKERWKTVQGNLERVGLIPERITGILYNGTVETPETLLFESGRPLLVPPLSYSLRGCFASHLRAISTFLRTTDDPYCLIMEDDVNPLAKSKVEFESQLQLTFDSVPQDWQGISLHSDSVIPGTCAEGSWKSIACASNAAYILSREGGYQILGDPWKIQEYYRNGTWSRFYVRPTNMFLTDETTSRNATTKARKSVLHRLSENVKGKKWHLRGEKSLSYLCALTLTTMKGHNVYVHHILLCFLLIGLLCTKGKMRWFLAFLILLIIPW